jgi:putative transposase
MPPAPPENLDCFIRCLLRRLRDECLNIQHFESLANARAKIEAWRLDYNQNRPHGSLGYLTPREFVMQRQVTRKAATDAIL